MANVLFKLEDKELKAMLAKAGATLKDLTPVMKAYASYMEKATDDRFRNETSPDGKKWAGLDPEYEKWKQENNKISKILQMDGYLRLVHTKPDKTGLTLASSRKYATIHQFGGTINKTANVRQHWRTIDYAFGKPIAARSVLVKAHAMQMNITIKARPFLGFSGEDTDELLATMKDWVVLGARS